MADVIVINDVKRCGAKHTESHTCSLHNVYHKHCSKTVVNNHNRNTVTSFTDRPILGGFFIDTKDLTNTPVNLYIHEGCGA